MVFLKINQIGSAVQILELQLPLSLSSAATESLMGIMTRDAGVIDVSFLTG
jgi:hypothetical protein